MSSGEMSNVPEHLKDAVQCLTGVFSDEYPDMIKLWLDWERYLGFPTDVSLIPIKDKKFH